MTKEVKELTSKADDMNEADAVLIADVIGEVVSLEDSLNEVIISQHALQIQNYLPFYRYITEYTANNDVKLKVIKFVLIQLIYWVIFSDVPLHANVTMGISSNRVLDNSPQSFSPQITGQQTQGTEQNNLNYSIWGSPLCYLFCFSFSPKYVSFFKKLFAC